MAHTIRFNTLLSGLIAAGLLVMCTPVSAQTVTTPGAGTIDCTEVTIDYADDPNLTEAEKLARMDEAFQRSLSKFDLCQTSNQSGGQAGGQDSAQDAGSSGEAAGTGAAADAATEGSANADATAEATGTATSTSQAPTGSSWGPPPDTQTSSPPAQGAQSPTDTAAAESGQAAQGQPSTATSDLSGQSGSSADADQSLPGFGTGSDSTEGVSEGSVASSDMTGTEPPKEVLTVPPIPDAPGTSDTASIDPATPGGASPGEAAGRSPQSGNGKLPDDIPPADNDSVLEAQIRQAAINEKDPAVQKKLWNEYRKYKGLPTVN